MRKRTDQPECGDLPEVRRQDQKNPEKSPGIAALCSLLFTGLGQVYNGNVGRGFFILLGTIVGSLFFLIPGIIVAVYGIYDAYKTAKRMNAGEVPYKETNALHMILFVVLWIVGIFAFIFLTAIVSAFLFGVSGTSSYY